VVETRTIEQSIALSSFGSDQVALYLRNPVVGPAVKAALQMLASLQQKAADSASQRAVKEQRVSDIGGDQSRIRANMDRLSQGSDLYKRYVKTLSDEEDELAKLRDDIAKLRDLESAQRKDVSDYIQTLEVS
jgi:succinate dehydrogenase/fumarate reductase flavoprotein subunit